MNKPILDLDKLNQLRRLDSANGVGVLQKLLPVYLKSLPKYLSQIEQTFEACDNIQLARAAHTLRSSSVMIGADALADLCHLLENLANDNQLDAVAQRLDSLRHECIQVIAVLEKLLEEYDRQQ
ncbi:Hpt domain-containing protein [Nitrosomonas sp. JL21]|uniref:Hpt domain-containing protein n=1 Tax=Nitrosomonas sp. JL21 TaxID=153949 RepID=UPI00136D8917|nr:Hpt domain-containing protein [Nitrosomonas sp. JL21]MBL8497300.1 Hpt domain-containing protein [Nitrosomonas sp.]MCC7092193.1 Hpt domain-containing protein [Nitrosomonas sp.]MXS77169.1 Hpt domain-containing protein [Nitrosomonas sp. JL21]